MILAAIQNAKEAKKIKPDAYIALDIGPIGKLMEPMGTLTFDEVYQSVKQMVELVKEDIDVVLLMSVNPGFGGQSFIEQTINKVDKLKKLIMESNSHTLIEIDGGVNFETGKRLVNAGADALVAGSFVFNSPDPEANIKGLKEL